ncbi:NAD(P)/FAD-dependent oxidoreductase [Mycoplasmatota bacterium]|nr:NAD(P)/FAD-dependent oxidoreductase [Mycoplasmatota bacterium]
MKRIVVLGGGYGGILTAKYMEKKLRKLDVKITIIDKNPYHTMLTELHEVAAGRVHEDSIKIYFNQVIAGRRIDFKLDEIKNIDFSNQKLISDKSEYPYDYLVIGTGCKPTFFGHDEFKKHVFTLWSLEDANNLHEHILNQFRKAAKMDDEEARKQSLSFVITGAGFTGVEMAGELAEYVPELCREYQINPNQVSIKLLDMAKRVLPTFPEKLSINAVKKLEKIGVECLTGHPCENVTSESISFGEKTIKTETIIWTTGVEGSTLVDSITEINKKGRGRLVCNEFLQAEGKENVYVVGDNIFYIPEGEEKPVPQMVENAENSSKLVAHNIVSDIKGKEKKVYKPAFHGAMVCIGGRKGLAQVGTSKMMFNIKNSFIALFIKHFINVIYFMQVLGWTKVWSYIKHEFFNTKNNRSMVGGLFSKKTPSFWTVPLRLWLGFMWFLQGLPKVIKKLSGGWDSYCTLNEFPKTFENNGLICSSLGKTVNFVNANPIANDYTVPSTTYQDLNGFDKILTYINEFFAGFKPNVTTDYGLSYNVLYVFDYYEQNFKWIGWLFEILEWLYNIFMSISDWFMGTIVTWMAPFFEFGLAIGELGIGILLILGLFTVLASAGSLMLTIMVIVGSLFSYNGIFLSELIWYLVASIVLLNFGGNGHVLSLDYYVMPKVHGFLQKIPFVKKWYIYGEKVDF